MKNKRTIVFTGGDTGGHVVPCLPLIDRFRDLGWDVAYIGSRTGLEARLMRQKDVPFYAIQVGKWRRYRDIRNLTDIARTTCGIFQSVFHLLRLKPSVIFAKGGFVSVPVMVAGRLLRIPVIAHEGDSSLSLTNRIALRFARVVCCGFSVEVYKLKHPKLVWTGTPVRSELFHGDPEKARQFLGVSDGKPILLVYCGSTGARRINEVIYRAAGELAKTFNVVHLTGRGNLKEPLEGVTYQQFEEIYEGFEDLLAAADVVVSRAGATTVTELQALRKRAVLIPLPRIASRGEQSRNARLFAETGLGCVLEEEQLNEDSLIQAVLEIRKQPIPPQDGQPGSALEQIEEVILRYC